MKRVVIAELLDSDAGTPAEVAASLADLQNINRWFGGVTTSQAMIETVARKLNSTTLSLLDVASGAGFVPDAVGRRLQTKGIQLQVTVLDRRHSHLPRDRNGSGTVAGDAFALPFADESFDLVSCCLFTHHLESLDLVRFVDEGLRVCRAAVLINDLIRHPIHLGLVYAGLPLFRSRLTHHDAPASVRRAYTAAEMESILQKTRVVRVEISRRFLFRMAAIAWKK